MMWDFGGNYYDPSPPPYPVQQYASPPYPYGCYCYCSQMMPVLAVPVMCPCMNAHMQSALNSNQIQGPTATPRAVDPPLQQSTRLRKKSGRHDQAQIEAPPQAPTPVQDILRYSTCTGRKKALCIGINYRGQQGELRGCVNDARNVRKFLVRQYGYEERNIILLTDDRKDSRRLPTRRNILSAMKWLVEGACPNDALFFHYSGHGGQTPDLDGSEDDGFDEVIFPLDYQKRGHIVDDDMYDIMVKPLPPKCRLTALFDSCHSGTVLDLPYIYSSNGRLKGEHRSQLARALKESKADVISWSACEDHQSSADTFAGGKAVGAMSFAFMTSLSIGPEQSYTQLLKSVREILYPKFSQKPQLGSSHRINTSLKFIC